MEGALVGPEVEAAMMPPFKWPPDVIEALCGKAVDYSFRLKIEIAHDLYQSINQVFPLLCNTLESHLIQHHALKFQVKFCLALVRPKALGYTVHYLETWFLSEYRLILTKHQIQSKVQEAINAALAVFDTFVQHGSGWVLQRVIEVRVGLCQYRLFRGGCLRDQLPPRLRKKRAILICSQDSSDDNHCFFQAVSLALTAAFKKRNVSRLNTLDQSLLRVFPKTRSNTEVSLKDVIRFEKETHISINVYGFEGGNFFPHYLSPLRQKDRNVRHANLLLHERHYYAIKDLSALVKSERKKTSKVYVCDFCLATFSKKRGFQYHQTLCTRDGNRYEVPNTVQHLRFSNFAATMPASFVIYADLESYMKETIVDGLSTKQISKIPHECMSWGCLTICRERPDWSSGTVLYTGENAIQKLLQHLLNELARVKAYMEHYSLPMVMYDQDWIDFEEQTHCNICELPFDMMNPSQKVRDHSHFTGAYRQALCKVCNLKYAQARGRIFVMFHGLSNYDSHFIIQELHRFPDDDITVIPRTSERYLSFSLQDLVFKDTFNFLAASLETLVNHLRSKGQHVFQHLTRFVPDPDQRALLYGKGVFPYTYIQSLQALDETSLPPPSAFFNDLTQKPISDQDYEFAQTVWRTFHCKTLKDYLHVYLRSDVLLLADVFENFRDNCLRDYQLDPLYYFSSAHFTFDAFLRQSQASLTLIADINQYLMFFHMIRGGLSVVSKRMARKTSDTHIKYFDANNLYGWAMMQPLPSGNFDWVSPDKINDVVQQILEYKIPDDQGFILEVDLDYPESLHDWHNDFPLAPEKRCIKKHELSPYAQSLVLKHNLSSNSTTKLIASLDNKRNYILYFKNLQLYTRLGMKLTKVHKILSFSQKPIFRDYIQFNSDKRAQATNDFDVNFYKFLSNSLFGKTMERPENKTILRLVSNPELFDYLVGKLTFKQRKIIHQNLVAVEMNHSVLKIKKPFYLGAVILELAKYHMYSFHYELMKPLLGNSLELLYTDTDSLVYEIKSLDINSTLQPVKSAFDFSNYPANHPLYDLKFKRVPGYFKDETAGKDILEFVGLRSKMYAIKTADDDDEQKEAQETETKHAKGVKKHVIEQALTFDDYRNCLIQELQMQHDFKTIASRSHHVFTSHQFKTSLSCYEDKRWLRDPINSFAYGHYLIPKMKLGAGCHTEGENPKPPEPKPELVETPLTT